MTTRHQAARDLGGFVKRPTLSRDEAERVYGRAFTDAAWGAICNAFMRYGERLRALNATRLSRSKDPAKAGWDQRQSATVKAIEAAMDRINAARRHDEFLREASDNYSIQTFGQSYMGSVNAQRLVDEAFGNLLDALIIVGRAEPMEIETPTEAEAQRILVRQLRDALSEQEMDVSVSDGRELPDKPSEADLTPFEQLVSAFGVHDGETPAAVSRWLRRALAGQNGGNS